MNQIVKSILFLLITMTTFISCSPKKSVESQKIETLFLLDEPRMQQIVVLMPVILKKAHAFQQYAAIKKLTDDEYNHQFYQYLFEEKPFAERLNKAGFQSSEEYQQFYDTMIETYLLLSKNPEVISNAQPNIIQYEDEINSLTLQQAQEPNNQALAQQLARLKFQLISYQNILIVSKFLEQLNQLNQ